MVAYTSQLYAEQVLNANSWEFPLLKQAAFSCPVNNMFWSEVGSREWRGCGAQTPPLTKLFFASLSQVCSCCKMLCKEVGEFWKSDPSTSEGMRMQISMQMKM